MDLTTYERDQAFNLASKWIHSRRYAHVLSVFRTLTEPVRVLDVGCGYAKLFDVLNDRHRIEYTGLDFNPDLTAIAHDRHGHNRNFRLVTQPAVQAIEGMSADVVVALETLEHMPEHDAVRVVEKIAAMRPKLFLASFPVEIGPTVWIKNLGSWACGYKRHHEYTWAETWHAGRYNLDKVRPHDCLHVGFDWRWMAQTIRHNFRIRTLKKLPLSCLPSAVSTSIFIVAEPLPVSGKTKMGV